MTPLSLSKSSPAEINAAVAEYCAGAYLAVPHDTCATVYWDEEDEYNYESEICPDYLHDANAVLPLLEKTGYDAIDLFREMRGNKMAWGCQLYDWDAEGEDLDSTKPMVHGTGPTFCLAAIAALLRAAGVKVEE